MAQKAAASGKRRGSEQRGDDREAPVEARGVTAPVVGIGASAGGVKAFQTLVCGIPADSGIAWVLILHMAPDQRSELHEILGRHTELPVVQVTEEASVEADHIYVIAPGRTMTIHGNTLRPLRADDPLARRTSIDAFLLSLAEARGANCGCALLSGAGTDGTLGLGAVKEAGGLTLTQTLQTAEYDSMLLSAVRTGLVDRELPVDEMPDKFVDFLIRRRHDLSADSIADGDRQRACRALLKATGHDFSGYKATTLDRRIRRRMQMLGNEDLGGYLDGLDGDKGEATLLFRDMLIGVTQFFRDADAFAALSTKLLPKIFEGKTADEEIRVWVPGCSTGEEAYSLAMLLREQAAACDSMPEIRVFGSDIDENALHVARIGRYPKSIAADLTPARLERFFEEEDGSYCVSAQLRETCLFAQHNMLKDPPFSRIDLISCRNVLIYMNPDLQKRLIPVFHYALRQDGYLMLGPAENAAQHPDLFKEVDRKHRAYQRSGAVGRLTDFPIAHDAGVQRTRATEPAGLRRESDSPASQAIQRILAAFTPAYVVIDSGYNILDASGGTGNYLELPSGAPKANLATMARHGLALDVKSTVAKVIATGRRESRSGLKVGAGDQARLVELIVEPLPGDADGEPLFLVVFRATPVEPGGEGGETRPARDDEIARALDLELQTTRERLQSALEELATSNEDLKGANEELSSVNEELQSSNEELETSKEELQSINEELRTVNNELSSRVEELSRANNDLKNLFANTQIAMLFLDRKFRIMSFTPPARPLFRLRDHDAGRPLDELASRLDLDDIMRSLRAVLETGGTEEREVQTRGEQPETFIMRALPYRNAEEKIAGTVLTFIDITERKRAEQRMARMVSELNHRVKNTLAGVQAILRQSQSAGTVEDFATVLQGRLRAMATAHNLLSERSWEHAELQEVATEVLRAFCEPGSAGLTITGENFEIQPEHAVSVGLILNELATNAAKYGAWSSETGKVELRWEYLGEEPASLRLSWTERGGPPAEKPETQGFGSRFIRQSVSYELQGECELAYEPEGFRCTIKLPAASILWSSGDSRTT